MKTFKIKHEKISGYGFIFDKKFDKICFWIIIIAFGLWAIDNLISLVLFLKTIILG